MRQYDPFGADRPCGVWGVNFGGGVNSTALLLALHDRGMRPDFVLFADTGSERPETYENVERVLRWCSSVRFPFVTVRWDRVRGELAGQFESVHDNCLRTHHLPSKAYGYSGCTFKWKIQPMQRWRKAHSFAACTVAVGYDAGEARRLKNAKRRACQDADRGAGEMMWYPLVGFGMDRDACVARIEAQGWPAAKSACFMCPMQKPAEWTELSETHPGLFNIAVRIDREAKAAGHADTKGLFSAYSKEFAACVCAVDGGPTHERAKS